VRLHGGVYFAEAVRRHPRSRFRIERRRHAWTMRSGPRTGR
jgi:hypothetical protein